MTKLFIAIGIVVIIALVLWISLRMMRFSRDYCDETLLDDDIDNPVQENKKN